jgi:heme exporter protein C
MFLRQGIDDPDRRARFGAVYTILGFISVPLTFISIRIFQSIHPVVIGPGEERMGMTPEMRNTMFFSLFTFSVLFVDLLWHRIRLGWLSDKIEQLRLKFAQ